MFEPLSKRFRLLQSRSQLFPLRAVDRRSGPYSKMEGYAGIATLPALSSKEKRRIREKKRRPSLQGGCVSK
jgi:hypothetical protein